jgi:hypothetical protein
MNVQASSGGHGEVVLGNTNARASDAGVRPIYYSDCVTRDINDDEQNMDAWIDVS